MALGQARPPWGQSEALWRQKDSAQLPGDRRLFHQQSWQPSGPFPRRQLPGSKRMALPPLPEASWLPHLEAGLCTFHLEVKVLPARPDNVGPEPRLCDLKPRCCPEGYGATGAWAASLAQCRKTLRRRPELRQGTTSPSPTSFPLPLYNGPCSYLQSGCCKTRHGGNLLCLQCIV